MRELDYKSKKRIRIAAVIIIILLLLFWLLYTFTKGNKTAEAVENLDGQSISQEDENKNTNNSEENNVVDNNTSVISNTEENNTATVGDTTNVARRNRVNNAQTNRQTTNNVAQNTENTQNNAQNNNNNNEQTTIVTLIGRTNIELNINDVFNDEGVTVNDGSPVTTEYYFARNEDSDVWEKADTIDTSLPGSYKILYTVGSGVYKRTLKIVDNEAPVLTLNGETRISLEFGRDTYTELGVAVTENSSETINPTSKIYYSATGEEGTYNEVTEINNLILGSYKVVYTAKDSSNNSSEIERIINVVDTTKPVVESITLSNNGERTNQDVTVTIKVNEAIKDVTGWNKVDDKTISKVFSANETNTVTIEDLAGNSIDVPYEVKDIDKTLPTGTVTYSTVDPTNQNVIVTITASKPILVPDGWTRGGKAYVVTKEYSDNIDENVTIKDLYGNEGSATVSISNIDRVAPVVESVTLSNNGGRTNQDVTVTIKVNEAIKDVTGWNKVDDKTISKVFSANETNTVTIGDLAGNSIDVPYEVKDIDKTLPTGTVTYSTVDPTNQNVIVTITASKPILVPDGWTRGGKAYVITKEYSDNIDENVTIKDLYGNEGSATVSISNIDKVAPVVESITLSNNGGRTNQDVTVTIKVNEAIKDVTGWNKVDDKTISKVFSANETNTVTIEDLAGNSIDVPYEVKDIDKTLPTGTVTYSTVDPTNQNVIVTITASKPILVPDGWTRGGKAYVITKEYSDNIDENVTIKDLYGNEESATVSISNIDRVAPVVESVTLSNNGERTNQDVTVTIKVNEAIKDVTGWNKVDDKTISKVFSANETNTVTIEDLAGNSIDVPYEVKDIDKTLPTGTVTYSTVDPTNQNVIVTITASKPILVPDGWTRGGKAYVITKEYSDNIDENITIKDLYGNENTVNVKIQNIDKIKPTVILAGVAGNKTYAEETIEADKAATYVDLGAIVTDNVDLDTTIVSATNINYVDGAGNVTAVNKVNMGVPGEYRLGYTYTDRAGNTAMARRIVKVVDTTKPKVILLGVAGNKTYAEETIEADKTATYVDLGAIVTDNVDPDTTIAAATNINYIDGAGNATAVNKVNMGVPGEYRLGYTYTDAAGNTAMARRIVKIVDTTAPVITPMASSTFEVGVDTYTYPEAGTVTDNVDSDCGFSGVHMKWYKATPEGEKGEEVAPFAWGTTLKDRELGKYYIEYKKSDNAGNVGTAHRIVTLQDTTAPKLTLNGNASMTLEAGIDTYTEEGATVTDNYDATISNLQPELINYSVNGVFKGKVSSVDTNKLGVYKIRYAYTDAAGNVGEDANRASHKYVLRVVTVKDTTAPVITLNGDANITLTDATSYTDALATVTDNHDATVNNLAPSYINYYSLTGAFRGRVNEVDVNAEGRYNLVYSTKDSSGNEAAKVTRIVYVKITNQTNKKFISTKEDLLNLATNPSEYTGKEVVITNNINLNGVNWNPINAGSGVLNGTVIDGRGHSISNMSINTTGEQSAGFIGFNASSVTIKNLTFENAKVKQDNAQQRYAGVVIGKNYSNITLENINVNNSEVENNWQCGGLVGFAETNGPKFKNCSITNSFVGGSNATAGSLFGLGIVSIEVENCKAENVRLYTDGMTWSSTQKALGNYWVGHIYGNTLTVNGSTETNVTVVDHK